MRYSLVKLPNGTQIQVSRTVYEENSIQCNLCKKILPVGDFYCSFHKKTNRYMLSTYCVNCNHIANYKNQTVKRGNSAKEYLQQLKHGCKANAKTRGIPYFLDDEWYYWQYKKQNGLCYYTGKEMTFITGKGKHINTNISIDRVDSNKPYIAENCVLCCMAMNTKMKNDMSLETLYDYAKSFVAQFERGLTSRAADGGNAAPEFSNFE